MQFSSFLCPWNPSGKNTGVGCHSLLQGIFPTQELNPGLPHCSQMLYCLSHQGRPSKKGSTKECRQSHSSPMIVKLKWKSLSHVQLFVNPWTIQSMEFSRPEYWSGSPSLLQGIFPIQGSNPGLPHCRQILYQLSYKGSPRILKWEAYPFSSRSSWPRNQTGVSCIAGGFFTN